VFDVQRYLRLKEQAAAASRQTVTCEEFIERFMAATGQSREQAEFQAEVSTGLGGETLVGGVMLKIVPAKSGDEQ